MNVNIKTNMNINVNMNIITKNNNNNNNNNKFIIYSSRIPIPTGNLGTPVLSSIS